jgi:hypothetical protein
MLWCCWMQWRILISYNANVFRNQILEEVKFHVWNLTIGTTILTDVGIWDPIRRGSNSKGIQYDVWTRFAIECKSYICASMYVSWHITWKGYVAKSARCVPPTSSVCSNLNIKIRWWSCSTRSKPCVHAYLSSYDVVQAQKHIDALDISMFVLTPLWSK